MTPAYKITVVGTILVVAVMATLKWAWGYTAVLWFLAILVTVCIGIRAALWHRERQNKLPLNGVSEAGSHKQNFE